MSTIDPRPVFWGTMFGWLIIAFLVFGLWGCPTWNVYRETQNGLAELRKAEYTKQISSLEAAATIQIAKGDSAAEMIMSSGFDSSADYLTYLYLDALRDSDCEIVYLPNDGSIPITEAVRLQNQIPASQGN